MNDSELDPEGRALPAALRVSNALIGETAGVYLIALTTVLVSLARQAPYPEAFIVEAAQRCVDVLASLKEPMH